MYQKCPDTHLPGIRPHPFSALSQVIQLSRKSKMHDVKCTLLGLMIFFYLRKTYPSDISICRVFRINACIVCVLNKAISSVCFLSMSHLLSVFLTSPHKLTSFVPPSLCHHHHHPSFTLGPCLPPPHPSFLDCLAFSPLSATLNLHIFPSIPLSPQLSKRVPI